MELIGEKVILYPFAEQDFNYFFKLFNNGNRINMAALIPMKKEKIQELLAHRMINQTTLGFVATRQFGTSLKKLGIVFLKMMDEHMVNISNLTDEFVLKGLRKRFKKGKLTYSEDIMNTVTKFCFENDKIERVETIIPTKDRLKISLMKQVGYMNEGNLKKYIKAGEELFDATILAKVKGG